MTSIFRFSKKRKKVHKKGFIDTLTALIVIFVFIVVVVVVGKVFTTINSSFNQTTILDQGSRERMAATEGKYYTVFDSLILFVLIGFNIAPIIAAFFIRTHPVFFAFSLFLLFISAYVGIHMGHIMQDISENADLAETTARLPMTLVVMQYLPLFTITFAIILAVVQYSKSGSSAI